MGSAIEAVNRPITLILVGKKYKARRISVLMMRAIQEEFALDEYKKKIKTVADMLEGDEKMLYITKATTEIPHEGELIREGQKILEDKNMRGKLVCKTMREALNVNGTEYDLEEVAQLIEDATAAEVEEAVSQVIGSKKGNSPAAKKSGKSRKNTGGRQK